MSDQTNSAPPADAGTVVTFATQWGSYNAGESAIFTPTDADSLIERGIATAGGAGGAPDDAPRAVFSTLAGIEHPPRQYPPNPQHPEIPQTYDPSPLRQAQRTARDLDAGEPGLAAREELQRFKPDPRLGAGPQPLHAKLPAEPAPKQPSPATTATEEPHAAPQHE